MLLYSKLTTSCWGYRIGFAFLGPETTFSFLPYLISYCAPSGPIQKLAVPESPTRKGLSGGDEEFSLSGV